MPIKRLTNRNDTYTTTDQDEAVYGLKGNDSITIKGVFYDQESDATYISVALSGIWGAGRPEGWPRREDAWVVEARW
jgi:hypothetical protein